MGFISDEEIAKEKEKQEFEKKVESKELQREVNKEVEVRETKNLKVTHESFLKAAYSAKAPKKVTMKDIEDELRAEDTIKLIVETRRAEELEKLMSDGEVREIKGELMNIMSYPHTDPDKRKIFAHLLNKSETVNQYVNDNVVLRCFNSFNSHLKFGAVYALNYAKTNTLYDNWLRQQAQGQAPAESREAPVEEKKEEPIEEL